MAVNYEGGELDLLEELPLLPIRDMVVYPFMIMPLFVGRESSIKAIEHALNNSERMILLAAQKDLMIESPTSADIYAVGTVAMIMRMRKLPDGRVKILVQGLGKARIDKYLQESPFFLTKINKIEEKDIITTEALEMINKIKEKLNKLINGYSNISPDLLMILEDVQSVGRFSDLLAANLNLGLIESQALLEMEDGFERLKKIDEILDRELEICNLQGKIKGNNLEDINDVQREFLLKEKIRSIKQELGEEDANNLNEFAELKNKILECKMPEECQAEALKQLARLERTHPDSSEANIIRNYLDWLIDLPWSVSTEDRINIDDAMNILNEDHYRLQDAKNRIVEYLAVRALKASKMKGPILCFSGPPGVGKTSLGRSIARATGRKFVRISLGGVKEEAEIRGHRRTYVGAMPGRIIQGIKDAKSNNPIVLLDEIDKLGADYKGDPSSALLEVLDPEQNNTFRDHYINLPFDLSNVIFITTANYIENIPLPLQDRMEIISLPGYTLEEKEVIARKYLIPKQIEENGLTSDLIELTDKALETVIKSYTAEAGLRSLERRVGSICRKVATQVSKGNKTKTVVDPTQVELMLGPPQFTDEDKKVFDEVGVSTGLAWTPVGGQVLYIESSKMKGKGLTLTGKLGDVMQESAKTALGYIRANANLLGIDESVFSEYEFHLHFPSGGIPKDGPSAGIAIATSLVSLLTGLPIDRNVAMTGEITLTGKVLPIGGLKEKSLAAMHMGIKKVIIPWKNKKDLVEIPDEYRDKIQFIPVKNFVEVIEHAIIKTKKRVKTIKVKENLKVAI